eukprot:5823049-Prymnesium_polylepis.3
MAPTTHMAPTTLMWHPPVARLGKVDECSDTLVERRVEHAHAAAARGTHAGAAHARERGVRHTRGSSGGAGACGRG